MPRIPTLRPAVQLLRPAVRSHVVERERGTAWDAFRRRWLSDHPLCVLCQRADPPRVAAATELDHIVPIWQGGGMYQVQGLCGPCHRTKTAHEAAQRAGVGGR